MKSYLRRYIELPISLINIKYLPLLIPCIFENAWKIKRKRIIASGNNLSTVVSVDRVKHKQNTSASVFTRMKPFLE